MPAIDTPSTTTAATTTAATTTAATTTAATTNAATALTPAQMSERTGVSIDTLRYYEREGLLDNVARAESGHRRYSDADALWVEVLRCLRETGMTIEQLRYYCDLGAQGDHTEPERLQLLLDHRDKVEQQVAALHDAIGLIDHKISFYHAAQRPAGGDREVTS